MFFVARPPGRALRSRACSRRSFARPALSAAGPRSCTGAWRVPDALAVRVCRRCLAVAPLLSFGKCPFSLLPAYGPPRTNIDTRALRTAAFGSISRWCLLSLRLASAKRSRAFGSGFLSPSRPLEAPGRFLPAFGSLCAVRTPAEGLPSLVAQGEVGRAPFACCRRHRRVAWRAGHLAPLRGRNGSQTVLSAFFPAPFPGVALSFLLANGFECRRGPSWLAPAGSRPTWLLVFPVPLDWR